MGVVRSPKAMLRTKSVQSPIDPEVEFIIKKATNREDVQRANLFSKVEYVNEDEGTVMRREFPFGDLQMATIALCLESWNLTNDKGQPVPITEGTLLDYLDPQERIFLYNEILEFNPMWLGREPEKNE